ncbi:MAG TPA: cyclic dehypoxanthinyl futalosine synthase [Terriglobia bacterium]|nr:cyclic dehypoxanthinyl futalosine synthase [Terriglobia bacterium]
MSDAATILKSVDEGKRVSNDDAITLFEQASLFDLAERADRIRARLHPDNVVSYIIDRNINYTNVCKEFCTFCAFYRVKGDAEAYVLPDHVIYKKIEETIALGGTGILMQGGVHPDLKIDYYERLLAGIKERFPIHCHCFSPSEILNIARVSKLTVADTFGRLKAAGLDSMPGGGGEILDDEVRAVISPLKCTSDEWMMVHRKAHKLGLQTTATMMTGVGENIRHRINHLDRLRRLQDETGGFTAFIPWTFQPENTELAKRHPAEVTAVEYLRMLALSRIYLDNIANVQVSWLTVGLKVGQVGLRFGVNDMGSIMIEENVISAAGARNRANDAELRRVIADAGFTPRQRTTLYERYVN